MPGGPESLMDEQLKRVLFDTIFHGDMALRDQDTKPLSIFHAKN